MILLDIAVFATADSNWEKGLGLYVQGANYHLGNYNMRLNLNPPQPKEPIGLPLTGEMYDPPPDGDKVAMRPGDLRAACAKALPAGRGIPVIFTKFHRSDAGVTVYTDDVSANRAVQWLNYVLIKENNLNSDRGALLHELIHAANYIGDDPSTRWGNRILHDRSPSSVMRPNPINDVPVFMDDRHAQALRGAYFARYV
jgi:hypothetical protein